jgi:starch synthase
MILGMKILMASSEYAPYAETGKLADDVSDLCTRMAESGHEVVVVLPLYRCVREQKSLTLKRSKVRFAVSLGSSRLNCVVWEAVDPKGMRLLFIERDEYFDRTGLYGMDGRDYEDNAARFIFFSKCVVEIARRESPDAIHVHGWQPALVPVFVREQNLGIVTVLSPQSLQYQGNFWSHDFALTNLSASYFSASALEFYGSMNFLKSGIVFADAVVLPGSRYVSAMQTPEHGCGLESVLREHSNKLIGIAPGFDAKAFPVTSSAVKDIAKSRSELFSSIKAGDASRVVVVDASSTAGHGLGVLFAGMDRLPSDNTFVVLLGEVREEDRLALLVAERRHAGRFVHIPEVGSVELTRVLEAGDFVLLPAEFEPSCEFLTKAMRNGIVPLARHCDGLHQIVQPYDRVTTHGNGLVFYRDGVDALLDVIRHAAFLTEAELQTLSDRVASTDFSWSASVASLASLYQRLTSSHQRIAA